jgi:hypothetical protein
LRSSEVFGRQFLRRSFFAGAALFAKLDKLPSRPFSKTPPTLSFSVVNRSAQYRSPWKALWAPSWTPLFGTLERVKANPKANPKHLCRIT